jgi:hypothetical protein
MPSIEAIYTYKGGWLLSFFRVRSTTSTFDLCVGLSIYAVKFKIVYAISHGPQP